MRALVLASSSPRRLSLLAQIGVAPSEVFSPEIDETPLDGERPRDCALRLAHAKARQVSGALVLGADTVVAAGHRILPRADDEATARRCLALLSGRRHRVFTGVVLIAGGRARERIGESVVGFGRLTVPQIDAYLAGGEWQGKAGGYAVQGTAASFVRFVSGSYSNIVGLPLFETAQLLRGAGWPLP